ncbi:MAG: TlpA family protein disulfide reductase [Pyrinomonadaceae bacterium]|nr:TlpA family protein disulfide reductase [Pyrinomonadaceae bacterium]
MRFRYICFAFMFRRAFCAVAIYCCLAFGIFAQKPASKPENTSLRSTTPKIVQIDELSIIELLKPNKKPLLVNFWATWCIPCREEFPDLVELDKEYKEKIDFITISLDDLAEIDRDVPKFLNEMKATMPAYLLRTNDENAVIGSISKDWQGGLPFTILYSEIGEVIHTRQGKIKPDIVKAKIDRLTARDHRTKKKPPCSTSGPAKVVIPAETNQ